MCSLYLPILTRFVFLKSNWDKDRIKARLRSLLEGDHGSFLSPSGVIQTRLLTEISGHMPSKVHKQHRCIFPTVFLTQSTCKLSEDNKVRICPKPAMGWLCWSRETEMGWPQSCFLTSSIQVSTRQTWMTLVADTLHSHPRWRSPECGTCISTRVDRCQD